MGSFTLQEALQQFGYRDRSAGVVKATLCFTLVCDFLERLITTEWLTRALLELFQLKPPN